MFSNPVGIAIAAASIAAIGAAVIAAKSDEASYEHGKQDDVLNDTMDSVGLSEEAQEITGNKTLGAIIGGLNDRNGFQREAGNVFSGIGMGFSKMFQGKNDQAKNYLQ